MTRKQIEKKYNCEVHMDWIDGFRFYTAYGDSFENASGWSLFELLESIEDNLKEV